MDFSKAQVEPNSNTTISLQLYILEVAGLRALIRENEQRRINDVNNRQKLVIVPTKLKQQEILNTYHLF